MNINIPGIDASKGLDLYDGDENIYLIVLKSWHKNMPAILDRIKNVSEETLKDYAISLHGIKGTSTSIGAESLRSAALDLELKAKAGDLSGILANNEAFIEQAQTLLADIESALASV